MTNTQLMLLDNLIYLNRTVNAVSNNSNITVASVVTSLLNMAENDMESFTAEVTDSQFYYCDNKVNGMNAEQWKSVLEAIKSDEKLMNLTITHVVDNNDYTGENDAGYSGFRAACFTDGDDTAVIFRGTVGSFQWDDNANGGYENLTYSQEQAREYLCNLKYSDVSDTNIYVSGHSKGGNMAQYAAVYAINETGLTIEKCLSFDGQGFSSEFFQKITELGYLNETTISKMYKISSEFDIVNSLFTSLTPEENTYYVESSNGLGNPLDYLLVGHIGTNVLSFTETYGDDGEKQVSAELNNYTVPRPIHYFMEDFMNFIIGNVTPKGQELIYEGFMGVIASHNSIFGVIMEVFMPGSYLIYGLETSIAKSAFMGVLSEYVKTGENAAKALFALYDCFDTTNNSWSLLEENIYTYIANIIACKIVDYDDIYQKVCYDYVDYANKKVLVVGESDLEEIDGVPNYVDVNNFKMHWFIENTDSVEDIDTKITQIVRIVKEQVIAASAATYDPLILDLDGDGFNVELKENGTNFDLDTNSFAEKINWTSKDGFLCLDLNGNGEVDNGGEVFGDNTLLADGTTARNGFEALAQYDSNGDGVIDANDEIFSRLKVWVDADGNGESGEGELKSLAELGIESISLNYDLINGETGTEAVIGNGAVFTYTDGTSGNIGELWVSADLFDTIEQVEIEIPDDIKALANVRSIGNVNSLHTAMALAFSSQN